MLGYNRTEVSQGIDVNKTSGLHLCECIINHYWYFLKINVRFQPKVCNGCHDLMQVAVNFNDVVIVYVKGNDYKIHFQYMIFCRFYMILHH